jgi:copper chaperone CopZ
MKKIVLVVLCLFGLSYISDAQNKIAKIRVKASIYCDHCQKCESCGKRLENAIYREKGVKRMDLDTDNKTVDIVYNSSKTDTDKLRQAIANAGFDADDVKGNPDAYATWDDCCKKQ